MSGLLRRGFITVSGFGMSDELYIEAYELVIKNNSANTAMLIRKFKIGYGRAQRILTELEDAGVVGPPNGNLPREVLLS